MTYAEKVFAEDNKNDKYVNRVEKKTIEAFEKLKEKQDRRKPVKIVENQRMAINYDDYRIFTIYDHFNSKSAEEIEKLLFENRQKICEIHKSKMKR